MILVAGSDRLRGLLTCWNWVKVGTTSLGIFLDSTPVTLTRPSKGSMTLRKHLFSVSFLFPGPPIPQQTSPSHIAKWYAKDKLLYTVILFPNLDGATLRNLYANILQMRLSIQRTLPLQNWQHCWVLLHINLTKEDNKMGIF